MVADLHVGDALPHLGDDAGALVAEDGRARAAGWCRSGTDRSEWHTPVASILTFTSPGPTADELDVVADLERVVTDVAEQSSAHVIPLVGALSGSELEHVLL